MDIIQVTIDALSQEYGRRDTPGWAYLFAAVTSVVGAISAKELVKKRKALRTAKAAKLNTQKLSARLISQEEDSRVEYTGLLTKETNSYRIIIEAKKRGSSGVVTDVVKASLDDVAEYLRDETKFILADFK